MSNLSMDDFSTSHDCFIVLDLNTVPIPRLFNNHLEAKNYQLAEQHRVLILVDHETLQQVINGQLLTLVAREG